MESGARFQGKGSPGRVAAAPKLGSLLTRLPTMLRSFQSLWPRRGGCFPATGLPGAARGRA